MTKEVRNFQKTSLQQIAIHITNNKVRQMIQQQTGTAQVQIRLRM